MPTKRKQPTDFASNLFDLTNEVAVAIGASGVLGGAMATGLAKAGAKVAILDINATAGEARVAAIRKEGGQATFFAANAMKPDSLHEAHLKVEKELGHPTILLNTAGGNNPKVTVMPEMPFQKILLDDWKWSFDLNLVAGALLPCQEFGGAMAERGRGSIINIASVSAHLPLSRVVAYSAAKSAVLNLTRFLAREWAPRKVRVNSITPGFFPAEQNRKLLLNDDGSPTDRTRSIWAHTPMARFGEAEELVGTVLFLASEKASSFVTGADIRVDGGFLCQTI